MRLLLLSTCAALALAGCSKPEPTATAQASSAAPETTSAPLTLAGTTDLQGYTGDFDHFAIDSKHNQLFLAGEDGAALEVFDLTTGALKQQIKGYGAPHSPFPMPAADELLVIDGVKPSPVLDTATLKVKRSYALPAGSDSIGYDASANSLWVVTGGKDVPQKDSNLIAIDPTTGKTKSKIHFDADHVEAMAVEQNGPKLYINVTDKNYMAVIDKAQGKVVDQWKIKEAQQNAPLAFDEASHRLFVVTRAPGMLLVLNSDTGATVASFKTPERADQVVWDPDNHRVYVPGGEGYISVVQQDDPDHYREIAKVPSLPGAKTAVLSPSQHRLYVAASPGDTKALAKLMWFDIGAK
jgi:DNA-binding beta-propeller fold protein YncE